MNDDMGRRSSSGDVEPEVCVATSYLDLMMFFAMAKATVYVVLYQQW